MFDHICAYGCTSVNGRYCDKDRSVQKAKSICDQCPVQDYCRWWSIVTNLDHGVAGALTYAQRLAIRKALRKDPVGKELLERNEELWSLHVEQ